MATIKKIAELAGVSRGTVDRVLNHRGEVSAETTAKINDIIKQLDYKPNKAGMVLAAQKKRYKIGIILFSKKNSFFDEVMHGFNEKADELSIYGCEIIVKRVAYNPDAQLSAIRACVKEGIQGLIIAPYNDEVIRAEINLLSFHNIPVVTVNSDIERAHRIAYVGSDYYLSGKMAASLMKLVTFGPVNLGVISGDQKILCHSERLSGFIQVLSQDSRFKILTQGDNYDDDQISFDLVRDMLHRYPEINAFYFVAAGVYGGCRAIAELTKDTPLRVITYDDVPTTIEMMDRGIVTATICQEPYWQGAQALTLLFDYLSGAQNEIGETNYANLSIKIKC